MVALSIEDNTGKNKTPQKNITDAELIALIANGDSNAYSILTERYTQKVWRLSFSILRNEQEAEDATQDVFLSAWQSLENWDINGKATFSTWIYRVTLNKCIDMKRKKKITSGSEGIEIPSNEQSAYHKLFQKQVSHKLNTLLDALPKAQQEAIQLYYFNDMSAQDVAGIMGKTEQSIRSLLKRAKSTLKETIANDPHTASWIPNTINETLKPRNVL